MQRATKPFLTYLLLSTAIGLALAGPGRAAPVASDGGTADIRALQEELQRQKQLLKEQQQKLDDQARKITETESSVDEQKRKLDQLRSLVIRDPSRELSGPGIKPAAFSVGRAAQGSGPDGQVQKVQGTAPGTQLAPQRPEIPDPGLAREGGVLTPRGTLVAEPSVEYSYTSDNRILIEGITIVPGINIGSTDVRRVNRQTYTVAAGARYGITDRFEVDVKVPYVYRNDETTARGIPGVAGDFVQGADGNDIGDVEVGAHYQINSGQGGWPFLIGNLRFKSRTGKDPFEVPVDPQTGFETELPTGTGFYSLEPSLTAILPSDPVVFFANVRYIWNIKRDVTLQAVPGQGLVERGVELDPGDGVGLSIGMGFGINEQASFSLGYEHTHIFRSSQDGQDINGSDFDLGAFSLGLGYRLSEATSINLGIAIGATENAPDARIGLRVPIRFQLF